MKVDASLFLCTLPLASAVSSSSPASAQVFERVSVSSSGAQADGDSTLPAISQDGRFIAFWSTASNLAANDANGAVPDLFLRDRVAGTTALVSVGNAGQQAPGIAYPRTPRISSNGRHVLFASNALDPLDTDATEDVYLRDTQTGITTWITTTNDDRYHGRFGLSGDGQRVLFEYASASIAQSIEVRDLASGQTWSLLGTPGSPTTTAHAYFESVITRDGASIVYYHTSHHPTLGSRYRIERMDLATSTVDVLVDEPSAATPHDTSADGRYLLFTDFGSSLVSGFTSLHRLDTLTLERERMDVRSIPLQFPPFGQGVRDAAISDAGEYVVFSTDDDHILPGDTNWVREPYMRVPSHSASLRAGLNPAGQEADDATEGVDMTGDGALIAFDSRATNLLASDTNGFADVFVRSVCADAYPDADGDAYGDASATPQLVCLPITGSLVLKAGDCDDGDPAIHPGVAEICDGVDQDCDSVIDEVGSSASFCQTSITTNGCTPDLFTTGCASVSAGSGFSLVLDQVEGQRSGLFFYAEWEYFWPTPWTPGSSSYICVGVPRQRTAMLQSGGTAGACDGQLALDFLTWSAAHPTALGMPLHAGQSLYFQAWFRDPPAPKGTNLSNGWRAVLAP